MLILLKIKFQLPQEQIDLFRLHLSPEIDDESEIGWEETTNLNMMQLIKILGKGSSGDVPSSNLKPLTETTKLKGNITRVCDKISKGAQIEL